MTLEVGFRLYDKVTYTDFQYIHFSHFFRLSKIWKNAMKRMPITIKGKHFYRPPEEHQTPFTVEQWGFFSWITSLAMDRIQYEEYIFPWAVFEKMLALTPMNERLGQMKDEFSFVWSQEADNCLGKHDDLGIRQVRVEKENNTYHLLPIFM